MVFPNCSRVEKVKRHTKGRSAVEVPLWSEAPIGPFIPGTELPLESFSTPRTSNSSHSHTVKPLRASHRCSQWGTIHLCDPGEC